MASEEKDIDCALKNLKVEKDAETLRDLCKFMNWTFTSKGNKVHWTEKEILAFMQMEIGEMLFTAGGSMKYDGLIVCISCHGVKDRIITSDFKVMEKTAIHRMLSLKYPKLREIPRIFVFDCCNGSDERQNTIRDEQQNIVRDESTENVPKLTGDVSKVIELTEHTKSTSLEDVENMSVNRWTSSTKNPDYNLVLVHAANSGFVAKMNYKGSYLVYVLARKIRANVEKRGGMGLAEVLEDVQNLLHDAGRQQTVNQLNNNTRTLVLRKNPKQ